MIPLVKFKYKKSGKSIKLKEIAAAMIDFSNRILPHAFSEHSLSTKLLYSFFRPELIKECADKSMQQFRRLKINKQTCARYLQGGFPDGNRNKGGISDLQTMPIRCKMLLDRVRKLVDKGNTSNDPKDNIKIKLKLESVFDEIEKCSCMHLTDKGKKNIAQNIENIYKKVENFAKRWDSNTSNLYLAIHDLDYIIKNKPKDTNNKNLITAEKIITDVATNIEEVSKMVNKHLPHINYIKVKSHRQYTNKLKHTVDHARDVCEMVQKKQKETKKQLSSFFKKMDKEQAKKIKSSKKYEEFKQNLEQLKKASQLLNLK